MSHSGTHPVQVVAISDGKGGVGKTNVSVYLGVALGALGRRATLLDANQGLANVVVLLIDTAAGISDEGMSFLCAAQEVLLVVCNMVRADEREDAAFVKLKNVTDRFLDVHLLSAGSISYDDHLRPAVQKQRSVIDLYPTSRVARDFYALAEIVDSWPMPAQARGHLEFLVEQLVTDTRLH